MFNLPSQNGGKMIPPTPGFGHMKEHLLNDNQKILVSIYISNHNHITDYLHKDLNQKFWHVVNLILSSEPYHLYIQYMSHNFNS